MKDFIVVILWLIIGSGNIFFIWWGLSRDFDRSLEVGQTWIMKANELDNAVRREKGWNEIRDTVVIVAFDRNQVLVRKNYNGKLYLEHYRSIFHFAYDWYKD